MLLKVVTVVIVRSLPKCSYVHCPAALMSHDLL